MEAIAGPPRRTPAALPFGPRSIAELVEFRARERPGAEALVDGRKRLTYAELGAAVSAVSAGLAAQGLDRDHRIAIALPNSVDAVVAYCAVMRLGACFVGVHPALTAVEQVQMLTRSGADVLLTSVAGAASIATLGTLTGTHVIGLDLDDEGVIALARAPTPLPPVDPFRPAALAATSGTTGSPKLVVHDQHHMVLPALVVSHERLGGRAERIGVHLPMTTLNVLIVGPVLAFVGGGVCICLESHDPQGLVRSIVSERIDHVATSPAVVHDLVEHHDIPASALAGLRLGVGGTDCPEGLRRAYRERFGRDFTTGYGLTEVPTSVAQETERIGHVTGGSGRALAHVGIEILDEAGAPLPSGVDGEIAVVPRTSGTWAGCWVGMHGYLGDPAESARVLADGRLRTGDVGHLDADGNLHVARRRAELINRGGSKVAPAEIEAVVRAHPDVVDCAVIGRPDTRLGETVAAAVQIRRGCRVEPAELAAHCRSQLAGFKVPSSWVIVAELPRNPMGKVQRRAVHDLFERGDAS